MSEEISREEIAALLASGSEEMTREPCEDAISRRAAIDAVNIGNLHPGIVGALQSILADLPSVTPKQMTGSWINIGFFLSDGYRCSECFYTNYGKKTNYCPNCGAKMEEMKE